jgi:hypothetical protein
MNRICSIVIVAIGGVCLTILVTSSPWSLLVASLQGQHLTDVTVSISGDISHPSPICYVPKGDRYSLIPVAGTGSVLYL